METNQPIVGRDLDNLATDTAALRALAQAAINVELFTIPLYMTTLYSIQGMHEINAADQTYYKGRRWPGASTSAAPSSANEQSFNLVFSVFIQEMLHLQLASNLAASMGVEPDFTSPALQTENYGWKCYGRQNTVIPHIIDLRDTTTYADVRVTLLPLNHNQVELFLAIEEPEEAARRRIEPSKRAKYFPKVPFAGWDPQKEEADLPLFGTIGYLYDCMVTYMTLRYRDGTTLWDHVYTPGALQRDIFNTPSGGHPMPEYGGFPTFVPTASAAEGLAASIDIITAITDQGEGSAISASLRSKLGQIPGLHVNEVQSDYRSSRKGLRLDYPSYDGSGKPVPSRDAAARYGNDGEDHYARFREVKEQLRTGKILTWDKWHAERGPAPWTESDLLTGGADEASRKIPPAKDVAAALNRLKAKNTGGAVFQQLSQVAAGAIAGVTRVLDQYWKNPATAFPFPSMAGSGDRVSICFAILGEAPDLALGIQPAQKDTLYHACQGLDLLHPGSGAMPDISTYHTCKGSNDCKGQGGCGFVHTVTGGGNCSGGGGGGCGKTVKAQVLCGSATVYSAPSDNKCNQLGGCAVPISASQLFPAKGIMQLFDLRGDVKELEKVPFGYGDSVYEVAWKAYCEVLKSTAPSAPPPDPPPVDDLRVALPPST